MQTTFVLATLAGSAAASHILKAAPAIKRDMHAMQARETGLPDLSGASDECRLAALDILQSLPTPAPEISSDVLKNPQNGDPCDFNTPSSLSSEYASWESELMDWYTDNTDLLVSAYSACSDVAEQGASLLSMCSTDLPELVGTKTEAHDSSKTPGSNDDSSGSDDNDDDSDGPNSTAGAPRETGMAMAAIAAGVFAAII